MNAGKTSCLWEKAEGTEFSKEWQGKQILSAPASVSDVPPLPQQKGTRFDSLPSFVTSQQVPWVGGMTLWKQRVLLLLVLYTSALHSADSYTFCRIRATKSVTCINGGIAPSREIDGSYPLLQQEGSMNAGRSLKPGKSLVWFYFWMYLKDQCYIYMQMFSYCSHVKNKHITLWNKTKE